jgi:hypothetical protein
MVDQKVIISTRGYPEARVNDLFKQGYVISIISTCCSEGSDVNYAIVMKKYEE